MTCANELLNSRCPSSSSGRSSRKREGFLARWPINFSAREHRDAIELVIELKQPVEGMHTYYAPLHERDIEHAQFPWTFQRYLYDCMHDYLVEMFVRTPQSRESHP